MEATRAYELARAAYDAQAWADAVKHAALVLCTEPNHTGAFELLSTARRHLERDRAPAGEQRILSVLMCDVVDSTRLPRLIGREPYRNLLRDIQEVCATSVTRFEGRIAQYLGDGILAYFSYPQAHEDDPLRAALAALSILEGVEAIRRRRALSDAVEIAVRIGIDTGVVMVGAMGAGQWTTADSIVGDPPSFAARLQAMAPPNGILASEATYQRIAPHVRAKPHRLRNIEGFDERQRTYAVLSAADALETSSTRAQRTPLVGRDAERTLLSGAWRKVLESGHCLLALVGEAGMGKSRLAEELVNLAHATGGTTLTIRCSALYRHVPFHSVAVAVRRLLGFSVLALVPSVEETREKLAATARTQAGDELPEVIAELLGASTHEDRLPEQRRQRMLVQLASLVRSIAAGKRFLLLIEDLHDADPSTLELIGRIAAKNESFAIVATIRPELSVQAHLPTAKRIEIGPLSDDASRALVRRILCGPDCSREQSREQSRDQAREQLIESVVARAGGSPLFAEELAHWVGRGQPVGGLPPALDLLLTARIDAIEPELRDLLLTASVIGVEFEVDDLAALVDRPRAVIDAALSQLAADGLVDGHPERSDAARRFRHSLYCEAAYQRLLPSERARRHLRLAARYESEQRSGHAVPPAIIAKHLLDGGAPALALGWWQRAALDARATAAHAEAVEHYEAALALLGSIDDPAERAAAALPLQLGLGGSLSALLGYTAERVRQAFERATALADATPHSVERFDALTGLYSFVLVRGELTRAEELVLAGLPDVAGRGLLGLEGTAFACQAYVRFFRGRLSEASVLCRGAEQAVPTISMPQDPRVVSLFLLGMIQWLEGDEAASEQTCTRAMRAANDLEGERATFTRAYLLTYLAWKAQMAGQAASARDHALQAIALSEEHGFGQWLGAATLHLGAALCELGELAVGLATLETALAAWRGAGADLLTPYFTGRLALARLQSGDALMALALLTSAIALAEENDERIYLAELYRFRAHCRTARGEPQADVEKDLACALAVADALGHSVFAARARTAQAQSGMRPELQTKRQRVPRAARTRLRPGE